MTVAIDHLPVLWVPGDLPDFAIVDPGMPLMLAPFTPATKNNAWIHKAFYPAGGAVEEIIRTGVDYTPYVEATVYACHDALVLPFVGGRRPPES
jgi:hypothetical protein